MDKQTEIFNYYLHQAFSDSIATLPQLYVLVPRNSCKGCIQAQMRKIRSSIAPYGSIACAGIVAPESVSLASMDSICPTKIDTLGLLDRINLPISGITLIHTENGRVVGIFAVK
ncbi:MAG: hypothetical protein ACRCYO_00740 [Bacteroidia bacterium]